MDGWNKIYLIGNKNRATAKQQVLATDALIAQILNSWPYTLLLEPVAFSII